MKKMKSNNRTSFEIYSKKSTILFEIHGKECRCSYCHGHRTKLHYGLNIPQNWYGWNAWYVVKFYPYIYIRWTNGWFENISLCWKKITLEK